jgi:hypothetical protein
MTALTITLALVAVVAAALAVGALVAWRRALAASARHDAAAEHYLADLRERLAVLERSVTRSAGSAEAAEHEFVITRLGESGAVERDLDRLPTRVSVKAPAFADAVLRESVVQTASFVQGLRRALAPETRNRIRFEMKREVKRTRKARRIETKLAVREYRARQRAGLTGDRDHHAGADVHAGARIPDEGVA